MISKISFLVALLLSVMWLFVFLLFNENISMFILAAIVIIVFSISYITRNSEK